MAITTFGADTPSGSRQSFAASDAALPGGSVSGSPGSGNPISGGPVAGSSVAGGAPVFSKYRLVARLGSGGMAEVFLALSGAHQSGLSKLVVLKVLRPDLAPAERADFARMFYDEGRLAMRLSHPNIVQAHEVGAEDTFSFIAMEYLEGQALSAVQERGWRSVPGVSLEMQLHVLCQVLEGLEYAHGLTDYAGQRLDIVHRDVSPQNVFVTYSGHTKLVDFGIAKTLDSNSKTAAGVVKGKVRYMAPEQVRCGRVDHRADLFSVGVMLWEAIARRSMHGNASLYEVVGRLVNGELPALRDAVPSVDRHLERLVARALAVDPDARYDDAGALREELLAFLDGRRKVSSRELGERVARLFEPEREAIGKVIWQAMNDVPSEELLARVNAARMLAELPWASTNSVRATGTDRVTAAAPLPNRVTTALDPSAAGFGAPSANRERDEGSGVSAHVVDATRAAGATRAANGTRAADGTRPKDSPPPSTLRRRAPWLIGLGGGLVALLAVLGRPLTAGTREPTIVDVPAPVTRVRLNLQATPPSARFVLDGQALDANPYRGERAMDAFSHTLEVSADGHQRRSIEVHLNRDLDLDVRLAEEPPPRPITGAAVPAASTEPARAPAARSAPTPSPRVDPRPPRSAAPPRRVPESVRAASSPPSSQRASSQSADDIYPDDPLPAPKPAPLEAY
jgi:serine/threonine protein kinase